MSERREATVVYVAGLVQGIVLVTFPAASTIFTDPDEYDLSRTAYGALFLPQVITAITGALLGAGIARRFGGKRTYLAGLTLSLASMALLVASTPFAGGAPAYALLLLATSCLGAGFGLTVPLLNTFTARFHPAATDRSVLVLNALLGAGTALAPVFVAIFVGLGFWWGLPVLSLVLLAGLLAISRPLPLRAADAEAGAAPRARATLPSRFWLFAGFAVLYGVCETMNGNWSQLDMTTTVGSSTTAASLALTAFWAMVTVGRVLFASIQQWFPMTRTYHLLPFVLAAAFVVIASLGEGSTVEGVLAFALAGLGCSALLPLTISFAQEDLVTIADATPGLVIASYQLGYGIAAFGAGPLQDAGVDLAALFAAAAVASGVMAVLSFAIAGRRRPVAALHPRPA